jgi:hypothetical protein
MPCGGLSRLLLAAAASGAAASAPPFQPAAEPFRRLQDAEKGERCMSGLKGDFGYKTCGEFCKEMKKTNHCKFCKCQVRPRAIARSSRNFARAASTLSQDCGFCKGTATPSATTAVKKPRVSPPASAATGFSSGDVPPPDLQARLRAKAAGARPPPPRRAAPPVASAAPASAAAATPPEPAAATPSGFAPIAFVLVAGLAALGAYCCYVANAGKSVRRRSAAAVPPRQPAAAAAAAAAR